LTISGSGVFRERRAKAAQRLAERFLRDVEPCTGSGCGGDGLAADPFAVEIDRRDLREDAPGVEPTAKECLKSTLCRHSAHRVENRAGGRL
jgi:hypothetical protein